MWFNHTLIKPGGRTAKGKSDMKKEEKGAPKDADESDASTKERPHGLFILAYAMALLRGHMITARGAILLAQVDRCVNPYWPRKTKRTGKLHEEDRKKDDIDYEARRGDPENYSTAYLRRILGASQETVNATIRHLHKLRVLRAKRLSRHRWRLWTEKRPIEEGQIGFFVPHSVRREFEDGALTPMEALVLSLIASFTRRGSCCHASNRWIGKQFGVGVREIQRLICELERKAGLRKRFETSKTHDTVRWLLPPEWPSIYRQPMIPARPLLFL